jgi:heterodisulfide reductase subunit A
MRKLGVFICHCGANIAGTVDVKSVAEKIGKIEDVAHSIDYIYMCSEPGQQIIREAIREKGLEGVVVACCSPSMHENTFRKAAKSQGAVGSTRRRRRRRPGRRLKSFWQLSKK